MSNNLTGQKVSFTYGRLIQEVDGSFYNGFGEPVLIQDASSLTQILINYVSDPSLGDSFYWDGGLLEVSTGPSGTNLYVKEASLGSDFYWLNGVLYIDVSVAAGGVTKIYVDGSLAQRDASIEYLYATKLDPSIDYTTYSPRLGDTSYYYDANQNVTDIIMTNDLGVKTVQFIYNELGDVSIMYIDNYGLHTAEITFEKDINDNIIAIHTR